MSSGHVASELFRTTASRSLISTLPLIYLPRFASFPGIGQRLAVQTPVSTPRLWSASSAEAVAALGTAEPFYAFLWPGSYALSSFISSRPALVHGKTVLDFGSGCGSAGIAALRHGAAHVELNDIDPMALSACSENIHENMLGGDSSEWASRVTLSQQNLLDTEPEAIGDSAAPLPPCDVLLCGDVFYDEEFAQGVQKMLVRALTCGTQVIVADPGRPALPGAAKRALHETHEGEVPSVCSWEHLYSIDLPHNVRCVSNGHPECHVWQLRLPSQAADPAKPL